MRLRDLLLLGSVLVFAAAAPLAEAGASFGIVVHGGSLAPEGGSLASSGATISDESGSVGGLRFPVNTGTIIGFEPYIYSGSSDDKSNGDLGVDLTSWGANITVGNPLKSGFHVYPFGGIGNNTLHADPGEISKFGYNLGLDAGFSPGRSLMIDVRGERNFVDVGDETKTWDLYTLGVGLRFGSTD